ncbi:hypothetical protein GUJ93_ZPchr0010g8184 [Zizania palustris]|uniref:Uncharacterized protein n=1 Tax=Zizania palustris TaxID=103762 RepID=A0A8J5WAB4_ZIZPA|nr:hypothetical protein GUJ93_ZPchr0010g8184 [Zizania palustris]
MLGMQQQGSPARCLSVDRSPAIPNRGKNLCFASTLPDCLCPPKSNLPSRRTNQPTATGSNRGKAPTSPPPQLLFRPSPTSSPAAAARGRLNRVHQAPCLLPAPFSSSSSQSRKQRALLPPFIFPESSGCLFLPLRILPRCTSGNPFCGPFHFKCGSRLERESRTLDKDPGATAFAGLYNIISPLGKDYDTEPIEVDQEAQALTEGTRPATSRASLEKRYSFIQSEDRPFVETRPEWMRKRFNLPANNFCCRNPEATDCFQWLCCCSCSLAQEVRTADYYDIAEGSSNAQITEESQRIMSALPREDGLPLFRSNPGSPYRSSTASPSIFIRESPSAPWRSPGPSPLGGSPEMGDKVMKAPTPSVFGRDARSTQPCSDGGFPMSGWRVPRVLLQSYTSHHQQQPSNDAMYYASRAKDEPRDDMFFEQSLLF